MRLAPISCWVVRWHIVKIRAFVPFVFMTLSGCVLSGSAGSMLPPVPNEVAPCRAATLQGNPVVAEWAAPEKATLEAMLSTGPVAVEFHGCSMRVATTCRLPGRYLWYRTTITTDSSEISDERSLWAKLPLGAASLSGELKAAGKLAFKITVAGHIRLEHSQPEMVYTIQGCERATHIVESVALGTYALSRSGSVEGKASGDLIKVNAGAEASRGVSMIRSAGDPDACPRGTDQGPDRDCSSPIQVFLRPVNGRADYVGPIGTVPVEFMSSEGSRRWDVYSNDQAICTTPCSRWIDPAHQVNLRSRDNGFLSKTDMITARGLSDVIAPGGGITVEAVPRNQAEEAGGVVATTFGGLGVAAAISLFAVGKHLDNGTMENAGLITILPSIIVTGLGIYWIVDSRPHAKVRPTGSGLVLAPGFVAGTF